jgi:formate/nitrite transporter
VEPGKPVTASPDGADPAEGAATGAIAVDALLPPEMARKAAVVGATKAAMPTARLFTLAVLGGAFIAFGASFATVASTGAGDAVGFGPARVLTGLVFSLGLVLVVVAGAELFTGNNLLVMGWVDRRISARAVLRNWVIVYVGNFAGAMGVAWLVYASGQYHSADGAVGAQAVETAAAKAALPWGEALVRGILANVLVCLAVWLCLSARSVTDKILAVVLPITAFVAGGFEHSVANMYFLPVGLFLKTAEPESFWASSGVDAASLHDLTWSAFLVDNLVPVTIGNLIGGAVLVGAVYALVYLRRPGS